MASLDLEESIRFLQDVLNINVTGQTDVPSLLPTSTPDTKLSFLETIIQAYLEYEPFQCISLMSQDISKRHRPEWESIRQDMFEKRGGLCFSLNSFMYALLASLGYDVSIAHATVTSSIVVPDNHIVVLVHDLVTPSDLHLVDVGCGYFIPRAIPLNFCCESPEYTDSFQTYKFVRESEKRIAMQKKVQEHKSKPNKLSSIHQHSSTQHQDVKVAREGIENTEQWVQFFFFNPQESLKNVDEFYQCFDFCYSDITALSMHTSPRALCWRNGHFVALVNSRLIKETRDGDLMKTDLFEGKKEDSNDDHEVDPNSKIESLVQAYAQYFPQFPTEWVRAAMANWMSTGSLGKLPQHLV